MATKKQTFARKRNWNKARVMGFTLDTTSLTDVEKAQYNEIKNILRSMIKHWEEQNKILGIKTSLKNGK